MPTSPSSPPAAPAPSLLDAGSAVLADRIRALDDFGRMTVLMWLAGYAPDAVGVALDEIDAQAAALAERMDGGNG